MVVAFEGISASGRRNLFELLLLPLDGGVENPRCLGAISTDDKPFWLGADPVTDGVIASVRVCRSGPRTGISEEIAPKSRVPPCFRHPQKSRASPFPHPREQRGGGRRFRTSWCSTADETSKDFVPPN